MSDSECSPEVAKSEASENNSEANGYFLWNKIQDEKLREYETKSTALVSINYQALIVTDKTRQTVIYK